MRTTAPPIVLIGAGGHAKVVAALALAVGRRLVGVCDPVLAAERVLEWRGLPVLGDDTAIAQFGPDRYEMALGIGIVPGSRLRTERFRALKDLGYRFPALIHPGASVDGTAVVGEGAQIMSGVVVQPDVRIGTNAILNTNASIDHDCDIGDHVHVAPGAVICGGVRVGNETFVGASATILQKLTIGERCLVAAGSTLRRNLPDCAQHVPHRTVDLVSVSRNASVDWT